MKVRILNIKTNQVRWVAPHIANNTKFLAQQGYVKQDLEEKKEVARGEVREPETIEVLPIEEKVFESEALEVIEKVQTDDEVRAEYTALTGKKPGIKKIATLLKEIEETKQLQ
jgi:hypothetical protein